ncbi:MAG: hypothetical protein CYPHOPRED_001837 [Cyphobasidiales sp. Tagirdzhanova-0007]|nr:MAG: hypothetical protein CYPHOPRED_001837 [Cyphobasidiales sp. Tagirdzhanova-0007]
MRESSHSFVASNRACVVITSQLYDRRAIDSPLPTLPLLTSLQSLSYLTSTSPRIREILTVDGGLERLITIVGACLDLAFPDPDRQKASARRCVPFKPFTAYANGNNPIHYVDMHALLHTYAFALQCLVNVGVRGSEQVRTRVVEAGVLSVVSRILSGFLATRRKERERRQACLEPSRSITLWRDQNGHVPVHVGLTPTTITTTPSTTTTIAPHHFQISEPTPAQPSTLPSGASRLPHLPLQRTNTPDTVASLDESEQDNDPDAEESSGQECENEQMDTEEESAGKGATSRSSSRARRGTVVAAKNGPTPSAPTSEMMVMMEDVIGNGHPMPPTSPLSRNQDQDGAAIMSVDPTSPTQLARDDDDPYAAATPMGTAAALRSDAIMLTATPRHPTSTSINSHSSTITNPSRATPSAAAAAHHYHHSAPIDYHFKEDDVLHCLHLLAYLSKYPHVRAVFHDPDNKCCRPPPPSSPSQSSSASSPGAPLPSGSASATPSNPLGCSRKKQRCGENGEACSSTCTEDHPHEQDVLNGDDDGVNDCSDSEGLQSQAHAHNSAPHAHQSYPHHQHHHHHHHHHSRDDQLELARAKALASLPAKERKPAAEPAHPSRSTANNVFSLVEQFTFRPSSPADRAMRLPTDIQYWAGVIMRNACRKDEARGGIRQYWCSARQDTPPQQPGISNAVTTAADNVAVQIATNTATPGIDEAAATEIRVVEDM